MTNFKLASSLISLTLLLGFFPMPVQAQQESYNIYGHPMPRSNFKEKLFSSPIPLNKPYSKLNKEHQTWVRNHYDNMPEIDTPPFPSKGYGALIKPIVKTYQNLVGGTGKVLAIAMIGKDGKVKKVDIYHPNHEGVAKHISSMIYNTKFDAATCDGKPCVMEYMLDVQLKTRPKASLN